MIASRLIAKRKNHSAGLALPAALLMILAIAAVTAMLSRLSIHNLVQVELDNAKDDTYFAAEGAVSKQISQMSVLSVLWSDKANLATLPSNYTEYFPAYYSSTNGIPSCSTVGCQRSIYPTGGGLIKNIGPVGGDGDQVDSSFQIIDQLDPESPPTPDVTLSGVNAWSQVERLDETAVSSSSVGGNLSNNVAEGGNARSVRYRITGYSLKSTRGRYGYTTVVAIAEMPIS